MWTYEKLKRITPDGLFEKYNEKYYYELWFNKNGQYKFGSTSYDLTDNEIQEIIDKLNS